MHFSFILCAKPSVLGRITLSATQVNEIQIIISVWTQRDMHRERNLKTPHIMYVCMWNACSEHAIKRFENLTTFFYAKCWTCPFGKIVCWQWVLYSEGHSYFENSNYIHNMPRIALNGHIWLLRRNIYRCVFFFIFFQKKNPIRFV